MLCGVGICAASFIVLVTFEYVGGGPGILLLVCQKC